MEESKIAHNVVDLAAAVVAAEVVELTCVLDEVAEQKCSIVVGVVVVVVAVAVKVEAHDIDL